MRRHLALVALLAISVTASRAEARHHVEDDEEQPAEEDTTAVDDADRASDESEVDDAEDTDEVDDAQVVRKKRIEKRPWNLAIGPYLWASDVDANVSLGSKTVSTGVDFVDTARHAKYGAEVLGELRYGRFVATSDLMYGLVAINGAREVGPLMVNVSGTASSLLVDGLAGYRLAGTEDSVASFEVRGGLRYQRTAVGGSVDVSGNMVAEPSMLTAGSDVLGGARAFVRPTKHVFASTSGDIGILGASTKTYSFTVEAGFHVSRVMVTLGWRTLTMERTNVELTMHGPRAAVQVLF